MKKRILSLDGGGTWALLQVMALNHIYTNIYNRAPTCREVLNDFDLVAANSGGSLTLAAMIEMADEPIANVLHLFKNETILTSIFSKLKPFEKNWLLSKLHKLVGSGPKYKASRKKDGLHKALPKTGHLSLHDAQSIQKITPHLLICSFDYDIQRAVFFKSQLQKDYSLVDAINAATNAPINYFDAPVESSYDNQHHRFWDGAVGGNNNPLLAALTEVLDLFNHTPLHHSNYAVLSIGTASTMLPITTFTQTDKAQYSWLIKPKSTPQLVNDIGIMAKAILAEPPEAATFMAHMFLGGQNQKHAHPAIVRLNPVIRPVLNNDIWEIPIADANQHHLFKTLINLDMDATTLELALAIETLGQWWINNLVPNQGIRYQGKTLEVTIGHANFQDALHAWINSR